MKIGLTPLKVVKSMKSFKGSLEELKKDPLTLLLHTKSRRSQAMSHFIE